MKLSDRPASVWAGGKRYEFNTLTKALLFCWDIGPDTVERIECDGKLLTLSDYLWK